MAYQIDWQVIEDTVDLKSLLPSSIQDHELRPIIDGTQLYVYLISYQPVRPYFSEAEADKIRRSHITPCEKVFTGYGRNRVIMIYPEKQIDPHLPPEMQR